MKATVFDLIGPNRIPTVKLKIPGKAFLKSESRTSKVKNYNFNVTEILDSDFKNAFPGIFDFTVEILTPEDLIQMIWSDQIKNRCLHLNS